MSEKKDPEMDVSHADPTTQHIWAAARAAGVTDMHTYRAGYEKISRREAKERNFMALYGGKGPPPSRMPTAVQLSEKKDELEPVVVDLQTGRDSDPMLKGCRGLDRAVGELQLARDNLYRASDRTRAVQADQLATQVATLSMSASLAWGNHQRKKAE